MDILGVDIGSVAISMAVVRRSGTVSRTAYRFHHGAIRETLLRMLEPIDIEGIAAVAATLSGPDLIMDARRYDQQIAIIAGVSHFYPDAGSILFVGGENFGLITFNEEGKYQRYRSSSSCAAGTGSFLDQQAERLNLQSIEMLSEVAFCNQEQLPRIASRCSVFARTDLIHAQQEGYSIGQISDGLCEGLARNVIGTLMPGQQARKPLILAGGVSMNQAVVKHLAGQLSTEPVIGEYSHLYGAIGAALLRIEEMSGAESGGLSSSDWNCLVSPENTARPYGYAPLQLRFSNYPSFASRENRLYCPRNGLKPVEVDIYEEISSHEKVYLGIDIGSTSTKAVLINQENQVLAGMYTRTSGRPLQAVQALFEALEDIQVRQKCQWQFRGVGTTGSGRRFIGSIIRADLMVDEITAHARAACELIPEVDTIIEIGGQDAKFTTLQQGMVSFSVMNNVCAAGTGSFIEEQAARLGLSLEECSRRGMNVPAPHSSDRCTVFMERDINHHLSDGYSVDEVMASVLHSVRENYLSRVAVEASIGEKICFQGATARNPALIAAFEQRLGKPIHVSRFCHLTGALGAALILAENRHEASGFRGLELHRESIPVENEICELCQNHCKINKVTVQGEMVAFGFMCGRDYDTHKYVGPERQSYSLTREWQKAFRNPRPLARKPGAVKIGIPAALYLAEELPMWKHFFEDLGLEVISSEKYRGAVKAGKLQAGAEFCAPMNAFYGHVNYLAGLCDYIFLPIALEGEERTRESIRHYCYSTQFAVSLATSADDGEIRKKALMPLIEPASFQSRIELFKGLKSAVKASYWEIYNAYEAARSFYDERRARLQGIYRREASRDGSIDVVLLGRPYTVLQNSMNKQIPGIFEKLGIKAFYESMLPIADDDSKEIEPLLKRLHWHYAVASLKAALFAARTPGLYPVYISSFKCSPDSFALEYFKRIMDSYSKPYLILELDEHDSSVGYETRIEAAVMAFRNHSGLKGRLPGLSRRLPVNAATLNRIGDRTLLFPCLDPISSKLIEAVLVREGIDARMVPLNEEAVKKGPRTNAGQCLPVNIITQSCVDYIAANRLNPEMTAIWMFDSQIACNIRMYPQFIKSLLEIHGQGMERAEVYVGKLGMDDISVQASIESYFAYMFGGMLRKIGCKIRPYEIEKGLTDQIVSQSLQTLYNTFLGNRNKADDLARVFSLFRQIEVRTAPRPKVAIFGDMYARDNDVFNQSLIHCIEDYGGEVITTPFSDYTKIILNPMTRRWLLEGDFKDALFVKSVMALVSQLERSYIRLFNEILDEPAMRTDIDYEPMRQVFGIRAQHGGESVDNLHKIVALRQHYPDLALFVQTNPAFCCAGMVTEAMVAKIESCTGVPVVTLNYDGTGKAINEKLRPYIKYARQG